MTSTTETLSLQSDHRPISTHQAEDALLSKGRPIDLQHDLEVGGGDQPDSDSPFSNEHEISQSRPGDIDDGDNGARVVEISRPETAAVASHHFEAPMPALERAEGSRILRGSFSHGDASRSGPQALARISSWKDSKSAAPSLSYPPSLPLDATTHSSSSGAPAPEGDGPGPGTGLDLPATHPRQFLEGKSRLFKTVFVVTTCATQIVSQGQFGMVMIPLEEIGQYLGTKNPGELSWMTASYGLTVGMFLIASGRLGDLYGPKLMWMLGYTIIAVSNLGCGFCKSRIPFDICRALAGIGAALSVPNAVAMLGRTYPPGPTRSLVFAMLGALAPVGFMVGGAMGALLAEMASVPWIWFFTAIFAVGNALVGILVLPPDDKLVPSSVRQSFDYLGTLLLVLALGLFNFTWNQAPLVGWSAPYVWSLLLGSIAAFVGLYFWEKRLGKKALIPTEVLSRTSLLVYLCLWLGWMSFGVFLFYTTLFIRHVRGVGSPLLLAAQMFPVTPTGIICALIVPTLITRFPGHQIFLVSMVSFLVGDVMAAVAPAKGYWSVTFPSLILVILGPDLSFSTGQLIVSNSVDREFQGIAGGIVSMITNYSLSIGLGMAGTVEAHVAPDGPALKGYRAAFYFGSGLATLAVVVVGLFVRMPKMAQYRE